MTYQDCDFDETKMLKRQQLLKQGVQLYPYSFEWTHKIEAVIQEAQQLERKQRPFNIEVSIAGRIWSQRKMGKAFFLDIKDETSKIQIYYAKTTESETIWQIISSLDIGDIIGVTGTIFKTKTGQLTIHVAYLEVLSKTVVPIPVGKELEEKSYGKLSNVEARYRERYLHWMLDNDARAKMLKRFQIIAEIRNWIEEQGFLEVTTPNIEFIYGGAEARPFKTSIWALGNQDAFLRISPELYLKRYIVAGFPKVYTICQNFRNEGIDYSHNPEFTMMEWYEAYTDYITQMDRFEKLISYVCERVCGDTQINYQGTLIDFSPPWRRLTVLDALKENVGIDADKMDIIQLKDEMKKHGIPFPEDITWGIAVVELFEATCEKQLIQPTFILDHPVDISPMTKLKRGDSRLVERFEPFVCGMEIGNAYSELTDPIVQLERFVEQKEMQSKRSNKEKDKDYSDNPIDADFIKAIGCGMPPTGGVGLGIDRIIMLLTNSASIRDVIPFPMIKPNY